MMKPVIVDDTHRVRRRIAVVVVIAAAVLAVAVVLAVVRKSSDPAAPLAQRDGLRLARSSCDAVDRVVALVQQNGSADEVFEQADAAVDRSLKAFEHDPTWLPLASGAKALRKGLADDSAEATRAGLQTLRSECRRARDGAAGPGLPPSGG